MYHKLLLIICLILLSACSNSIRNPPVASPQATGTARPVADQEFINFMDKNVDRVFLLRGRYSPNGKWYILPSGGFDTSHFLIVESTHSEEPNLSIYIEKGLGRPPQNEKYLPGFYISHWSPDSTAFLAYGNDVPMLKVSNFLVIFEITDQHALSNKIIEWPGVTYLSAEWSPDSQKIAVWVDPQTIFLIDRNGNLLDTLVVNPGVRIDGILWADSGILIKSNLSDLYFWDIRNDTLVKFFSNDSQIVMGCGAYNSEKNSLLLLDTDWNELKVVDISLREIVDRIPFATGNDTYVVYTPSSNYVGIQVGHGDAGELYIFNWQTHEIRSYGEIYNLIGWFDNVSGILAVKKVNNKSELLIITP